MCISKYKISDYVIYTGPEIWIPYFQCIWYTCKQIFQNKNVSKFNLRIYLPWIYKMDCTLQKKKKKSMCLGMEPPLALHHTLDKGMKMAWHKEYT